MICPSKFYREFDWPRGAYNDFAALGCVSCEQRKSLLDNGERSFAENHEELLVMLLTRYSTEYFTEHSTGHSTKYCRSLENFAEDFVGDFVGEFAGNVDRRVCGRFLSKILVRGFAENYTEVIPKVRQMDPHMHETSPKPMCLPKFHASFPRERIPRVGEVTSLRVQENNSSITTLGIMHAPVLWDFGGARRYLGPILNEWKRSRRRYQRVLAK